MFILFPITDLMILLITADKAFEGGKAIGRFQALLADLPGKPLFETIPSFHDIGKRMENFMICLEKRSGWTALQNSLRRN